MSDIIKPLVIRHFLSLAFAVLTKWVMGIAILPPSLNPGIFWKDNQKRRA